MRCLKRSSEHLTGLEVEKVISKYMDDLAGMGFGYRWRRSVLESTMKEYRRVLWRVCQGQTKRNRLGAETSTARRVERLVGSSSWFKKQKEKDSVECKGAKRKGKQEKWEDKPLESVLFIP